MVYSVAKRNIAFEIASSGVIVEGFLIRGFFSSGGIYNNGETSKNVIVRNNTLTTMRGYAALAIGGADCIVENNTILENQGNMIGILSGGSNITIRNNTLRRISRQGIWFMNAHNSKIVNNTINEVLGQNERNGSFSA